MTSSRRLVSEGGFRFSQFAHLIELSGRTIAFFNALNRKVLFADPSDPDISTMVRLFYKKGHETSTLSLEGLTKEQSQFIEILVSHGIVVDDSYSEEEEIKKLRERHLGKVGINTLYLLLTDRCNFDCSYCFFEKAFPKKREYLDMSKDVARRGIDLFQKSLTTAIRENLVEPSDVNVFFYGGEPLLNMQTLEFAVNYINALREKKRLPPELSMNINTNGSLLTATVCKFLKKNNIENDVSVDGPAAIHDYCRRYKNGKTTFDDVARGFRLSKEEGVKTCVSCTISQRNVDSLSAVFNWLIEELDPDAVGFNPLLLSPGMQLSSSYYEKAARALIECFKIARAKGIYEARMMRKVAAFIKGYAYPFDCCAHGKQLVVSPNGKVGVCHAYWGERKYFIEMTKEFDPNNHPYWTDWSQISPLRNETCLRCEALTICGGGCTYNAEMQHGKIDAIDTSFCPHAKSTLRWLIEDLYEKRTVSGS